MMNRKYKTIAVMFGLLLQLVACSRPSPTALQHMRVCLASTAAQNFVLRYAVRSGVFADNGLDVEEIAVKGSVAAVSMLTSGEADACTMGADAVVAATTKGADLAFILSFFNRNQAFLVASADIHGPQDLVGKKIAGQRKGTVTDRMLRAYVRKYGVAEDQVEFLDSSTTSQSERLAAVLSGNAAATMANTVMEEQIARSKGLITLVRPEDVDVSDRMGGAFAASRSQIAAKRDMYLRFVKALLVAAAKMRTDEAGVKDALAAYLKLDEKKDEAMLQAGYDKLVLKYMDAVPQPSTRALQVEIDALAKNVPAAAQKKPADFIDATLLDEAAR